jgi:GT2 family glycosyltransferase
MSEPSVSIIIATRDRQEKLSKTVARLHKQDLDPCLYELIVVDDGSNPPVRLAEGDGTARVRVTRSGGEGRSLARNRGAAAARGERLVFLDDDMCTEPDFLSEHLRAFAEWPDALIVGGVSLPASSLQTPFGRFRQALEQRDLPRDRGLTSTPNMCTAANMSIAKDTFRELGGFDPAIASGEDQDLAIRHTGRGGRIAFAPEAMAVHNDSALDIRSYCRRVEWGAQHMVSFCRRYPNRRDNIERERTNGFTRWGREPLILSLRKATKVVAAAKPVASLLLVATGIVERLSPRGRLLDCCYRLLLGAHILRGYRSGLSRHGGVKATDSLGSRPVQVHR